MAKKENLWKKVVSLFGVLCYLVLLPTLTLAQGTHDIDQLQKELKYSSGQQKLNVLKDIVTYYYKVSYQEANQYLEQYLELAQAIQSLKDLAKAHYLYASIAINQLEYDQTILHSKKALTYYEALTELDAGMPHVGKSGVDNLLLDYYSIYILVCNRIVHKNTMTSFAAFKNEYQSAQYANMNLFSLLENLLEWTRSSLDGIKYKPVLNDLNLIVEHSIHLRARNASEKKITLNNHIPKDTFVFADENMLRTIIRNLTSNAIKFTNTGGSKSYLAHRIDSGVKCTVQDTGTGIAPEDIKTLFAADSETRKRGTANEGSISLGLVLVKEFVEKNKGKLSVESQPGVGSAFSFELPVK